MLCVLQRYGWVLAAPTEDFSVAFLEISAIGGDARLARGVCGATGAGGTARLVRR